MDMLDIEREQREENTLRLVQDELNSSKKNKGAGGGGGGDVDLSGVQIGMPPPVRIVVGNKCDLKDARAVEAKQGLEYARARGAAFMETSAREMVNIEETFSRTPFPFPFPPPPKTSFKIMERANGTTSVDSPRYRSPRATQPIRP